MSEIVERVARAIDEAVAKWQPGSHQSIKEMAARAAIEAMREPTDAMQWAGGSAMHDEGKNSVEIYQAYIDEALK